MKKIITILYAAFLLGSFNQLNGQGLLINESFELAGLQCFPVFGDTISYYYLPSIGALAKNERNLPEFSYLRYVTTKESTASDKGITEAEGGAILHFLATYTTPEKQIKKAEKELKRKVNEAAILKGPVIFKDAKYTIISSILGDSGENENKVITTGEAPIFQNSKLAFSFELDAKDSKLLLESFKMSTPDISIIFEFTFEGLSDDFYGEVKVEWDEMMKSNDFGIGGFVKFIGADIKASFEKMRKNNTIEVVTIGKNEHLESLMEAAYNRLLNLVFEPAKQQEIQKDEKSGIFDAIGQLAKSVGGALNKKGSDKEGDKDDGNDNGGGLEFGLNATYKFKEFDFKGTSIMKFSGRESIERKHFITFNIGDIYRKYGNNEMIFKKVSLYDPAFLQRDVYVGIDGSLQSEFNQLVNNVTVTLKKDHSDGSETLEQLSVNKKTLEADSRFILSYLNNEDEDLEAWQKYKYQTHWQFVGGAEYVSDWLESSAGMINLYVPYKRKAIDLFGGFNNEICDDVRAISVQVGYPFFEEEKSEMLNILSSDNNPKIEVTLPLNVVDINYAIKAYKNDGTTIEKIDTAQTSIIFIDDVCREQILEKE